MMQIQIPYGEAITIPLGSLRNSDGVLGAFMTPTFAAGDVTTQQDDGSGYENADDATPTLDGSTILLDVSAAEASPPAVLEGRRVYRFVDLTDPAAWIPQEFQIVTTDHELAAIPNGVIKTSLGNAAGQTATNIRLAADPAITLRAGYFFIVTAGTGAGQAGYIQAYSAGATFNLTVKTLDTVLDDTSVIKFYVDRPEWLSATEAQNASLAALESVLVNGVADSGSSTSIIVVKSISPAMLIDNQFKGGIIKFKPDTTTATLRNVSARIIASDFSSQNITLNSNDALPATPAEDDEFWIL